MCCSDFFFSGCGTNYLTKFVRNYSKFFDPVTKVLRSDVPYVFISESRRPCVIFFKIFFQTEKSMDLLFIMVGVWAGLSPGSIVVKQTKRWERTKRCIVSCR